MSQINTTTPRTTGALVKRGALKARRSGCLMNPTATHQNTGVEPWLRQDRQDPERIVLRSILTLLNAEFPKIPIDYIKTTLQTHKHLFPTYTYLANVNAGRKAPTQPIGQEKVARQPISADKIAAVFSARKSDDGAKCVELVEDVAGLLTDGLAGLKKGSGTAMARFGETVDVDGFFGDESILVYKVAEFWRSAEEVAVALRRERLLTCMVSAVDKSATVGETKFGENLA
ncbi:hypothetical protein B0A55_00998 [Friedmanniomyces simplex]|uniref:Uncharacterized protein n=1 Tax=Friedmanniomyces simplex TaxID=329884 RepID=A0A4U0XZ95_9PEZI|nr:hypothetical protein B0A55_00998 [Friedmanniomyces simplex]